MGIRKATDTSTMPEEVERSDPECHGKFSLQGALPSERISAIQNLDDDVQNLNRLLKLVVVEIDPTVMEVAFNALLSRTLDIPEHHDIALTMLSWLTTDDPVLRNALVDYLSYFPDVIGKEMNRLLNHENKDQRIATLDILRYLDHPNQSEWLQYVLLNDDHVNVVATALERVMEKGDAGIAPAVKSARLRFRDSEFVSFAADAALQRLHEAH